MLTFQISLHINDLLVLEEIKNKLKCGHISISGSRLRSVTISLMILNHLSLRGEVIVPVFTYANLNSSKYHDFIIFSKAVNIVKNKKHLSAEGKLEMISLYKEKRSNVKDVQAPSSEFFNREPLSVYWLGGCALQKMETVLFQLRIINLD